MASITFAIDVGLKTRIEEFPWVNWSEIARENLMKKSKLEELHERLTSKEEEELIKWAVTVGKSVNKSSFKRLFSKLSKKEKQELGL